MNSLFFLILHPGPFFSLLVFVLLFTSLWTFSVVYLVWLYMDWDTPNQGEFWMGAQVARDGGDMGVRGGGSRSSSTSISLSAGGRRSEWIRNQAIWRQLRDYYPVKVMGHSEETLLPPSPHLPHLGALPCAGA